MTVNQQIKTNERKSHLINEESTLVTLRSSATFGEFNHLEMDLIESQWVLLSRLVIPVEGTHRGRPQQDAQRVLNGVFWVLRTGARWADLPKRYPPHQTCHRRFRQWLADGTLFRCFHALFLHLYNDVNGVQLLTDQPSAAARTAWRQGEELWLLLAEDSRSWRWQTALLLRCPLARQAFKEAAEGVSMQEHRD